MSHPNTDRDERLDPELDALSWNPTAEEADAYLRGHGVIKKCEHCGQDATLTNDFVTHLLARFGERMREADDAATRMRDLCIEAIKSLRAVPHGAAYNNAINDAIHKVESLTLEQEQEKSK